MGKKNYSYIHEYFFPLSIKNPKKNGSFTSHGLRSGLIGPIASFFLFGWAMICRVNGQTGILPYITYSGAIY